MRRYIFLLLTLLISSCTLFAQKEVVQYKLKVEASYPHHPSGYTQGLFFADGSFYESSGQYSSSTLREVDLKSGKILREYPFPAQYFAEGSCGYEGRIYVLTWKENVCFVFDRRTLTPLAQLRYQGEGWGLTTDGQQLIMSDGTSSLTFRDPMTFAVKKTLKVQLGGRDLPFLNELEYIDGKIWANVYGWDDIFIIDPATGKVEASIDCAGLLEGRFRTRGVDVLNGIACDPADGSIYLTGKYWPRLYKVSLIRK